VIPLLKYATKYLTIDQKFSTVECCRANLHHSYFTQHVFQIEIHKFNFWNRKMILEKGNVIKRNFINIDRVNNFFKYGSQKKSECKREGIPKDLLIQTITFVKLN